MSNSIYHNYIPLFGSVYTFVPSWFEEGFPGVNPALAANRASSQPGPTLKHGREGAIVRDKEQ